MTRCLLILTLFASYSLAQIPKPADAPPPRSPAESAKVITLADGFRLELLAAEPLVREPSGMCWDERGRLFVCELHGYNLEGQLDVDEWNKTGKLDREVGRYFASPAIIAAAKKEQYGTVKMLVDSDGDGVLDKAVVLADRLPACYGLVPYRGGLIVACAPEIVYITVPENGPATKETLFNGFQIELMERRISNPQWGTDGWIYFGRGGGASTITGPHLKIPVRLPHTDFRIKPDGSAIEPVTGGTKTIGFASTAMGDRFVIGTNSPAYLVPPLDWKYLARNPYAAASLPDVDISKDQRCYPTSQPHPWRTKRATDPGFEKYYRERYGAKESAANGFFTSLCSPMVYRDTALPDLRNHLLACEPAQNLVFRGVLGRENGIPTIRRPDAEAKREFLASEDIWFHPIALATAPDGSIVIADFYREIIEDYSAIPRFLQQQYGLTNGKDHGRLWRLTHKDHRKTAPADMSKLSTKELVEEIVSPQFWRRETARRLLLERKETAAVRLLEEMAPSDPEYLLNVIATLDGLNALTAAKVEPLLAHANPQMRIQGLKYAERWLNGALLDSAIKLADDADPGVVLQAALSLGESKDARVLNVLAQLARTRGNQRWVPTAILSSLDRRSGAMLANLLNDPKNLGQAAAMLGPLAANVAARQDPNELSNALVAISKLKDRALLKLCLNNLKQNLKAPVTVSLNPEAVTAVSRFADDVNEEVSAAGKSLQIALRLEEPSRRSTRLAEAAKIVTDPRARDQARLNAVAELAFEHDAKSDEQLLAAVPSVTPKVQVAILAVLFASRDRHAAIVSALERKQFPPSLLDSLQRAALLESPDGALRTRAKALLDSMNKLDDATYKKYTAALANPRDPRRGGELFVKHCGICHQAHGRGVAVGPNLSSEFQRAEETIIRDILAPSDVLSPGFTAYSVETESGQVFSGLLAAESAASITLRSAEAKEQVVLRRDIAGLKSLATSLMPDDLTKVLTPQDVADVIAWLRDPPKSVMLLDENPEMANLLKEGKGTARFIATDKYAGTMCLEVTPLQRFSPKLPGWDFKIRERPGAGEYRYLQFAWKAAGDGAMIELAADGRWPDAKQPTRRYYSGRNTTEWAATKVSDTAPRNWTLVKVDLWKDFGNFTLTGFAPTAMGAPAWFDAVELLRD